MAGAINLGTTLQQAGSMIPTRTAAASSAASNVLMVAGDKPLTKTSENVFVHVEDVAETAKKSGLLSKISKWAKGHKGLAALAAIGAGLATFFIGKKVSENKQEKELEAQQQAQMNTMYA